jgi:hypothetical protein
MSPLTLTFWRGGAQVPSGGEIHRVAWDRCAERVRAPGAALESRDKLAHPMWAFATYRDGYRTKANLVEVTAIVCGIRKRWRLMIRKRWRVQTRRPPFADSGSRRVPTGDRTGVRHHDPLESAQHGRGRHLPG